MAINLLRDERVSLAADEEWRFEVDYGAQAAVTLKEGLAEIFGTELVRDRRYTFSGVKLAVFTWHGCSLEVEGAFSHQYIARETPMLGVLKFHEELEQRRSAALAALGRGPRVMVVGSDDCGKSTLCRILANYAARRSHGTTFVDLDVGQQLCGLTGSVSAVAWHAPFDLELGAEYAAPVRSQPRCRATWLCDRVSSPPPLPPRAQLIVRRSTLPLPRWPVPPPPRAAARLLGGARPGV